MAEQKKPESKPETESAPVRSSGMSLEQFEKQLAGLRDKFRVAKNVDEQKAIKKQLVALRAGFSGELPEKATPAEWLALDISNMPIRKGNERRVEHAAAEGLHGWRQHAHHEGRAMRLTRADYEAALAAINNHRFTSRREPTPHPAALSPHLGKRV